MDEHSRANAFNQVERHGIQATVAAGDQSLQGDGVLEIERRRGQEVRLHLVVPASSWQRFRPRVHPRLDGSGERGNARWQADTAIDLAASPRGQLTEVTFLIPELHEQRTIVFGDVTADPQLHAWLTLSRSRLFPRVRLRGRESLVATPAELASLTIGESTLHLLSRVTGLETVDGAPYQLLRDEGCARLVSSVRADAPDAVDTVLRDLRGFADSLAMAMSVTAAETVTWTELHVLTDVRGVMTERVVRRSVDPAPAGRDGSSTVLQDHVVIALPRVFAYVHGATGKERERLSLLVDAFTGSCSRTDPLSRLRFAMTALDLLSHWGDRRVGTDGERRAFERALDAACTSEKVSPTIAQVANETLRAELRRSLHNGLQTLATKLEIPHADLFPDGFQRVVKIRNSVMHEGWVPESVASIDEWNDVARRATLFVARGILRLAGVSIDPETMGAWWPTVRICPRQG